MIPDPRAIVLALALAAAGDGFAADPALARLFTPPHPVVGRYEVLTTAQPLSSVAEKDWPIETIDALDAFGTAGPYDRAALAKLYAGRRVQVSRGWREEGSTFESITLISPYPDTSLTKLIEGTIAIRFSLERFLP
jgi:hypothetical protein